MCLITTQREPKVATEDMVVYKALVKRDETTASSVYQSHKYTLGQLYTTEIGESDEWCAADYADSNWLTTNYPDWHKGKRKEELICIGAGYHAGVQQERIEESFTEPIYECTIPKGSEYYLDATGLIVSNQIIINKKITE